MVRCVAIIRNSHVRVFLLLFVVGLAWALYTRHAWEDYYITYRASKNLATGQGLTFEAGERVHAFTSPLGVLLPALASLLTANRSDAAALWIFRVLSISAFAGAGVLLWRAGRALFSQRIASVLLLALFATDAKIVDFCTNGMETGFLLFFLVWTLYSLLAGPAPQCLSLGCAWAGLMWSRPDSIVYIGALAIGILLFRPIRTTVQTRRAWLKTFLTAGVISTVLYLPWLLWAWKYYGTPVPHTITAKGLFSEPTTLLSLGRALWKLPATLATHRDLLTTTFMPPYSANTGWPVVALRASYWVALGVMVTWFLPRVRPETRAASFGFFVGQLYLNTYVGFPVPWYLPTLTVFAFFVISGLLDQMLSRGRPGLRPLLLGTAGLLWLGGLTILCLAAYQMRWQQRLFEDGQRTAIGRWLRANATSPKDTVFLEPLGYIGFYSRLKMLDYPGLSSPEIIAARKRANSHAYPFCWPELIFDLSPDWIVLRPYEAAAIRQQAPNLFERFYSLAQTFDVRSAIAAVRFMPGRDYLANDAYFEVYHRKSGWPEAGGRPVKFQRVIAKNLTVNETFSGATTEHGVYLFAHAPSRLTFKKPAGVRWLTGSFVINEDAYADNRTESTDGARFEISWIADSSAPQALLSRSLDPRHRPPDRGHQSFAVEFPVDREGTVELVVSPGPSGQNNFDWTQWSSLVFVSPVE